MKILLTIWMLILAADIHAETIKFQDWQLDCSMGACAAVTYKAEGSIKGYPSIRVAGKTRAKRILSLADAEIMDGTKPIRIQVDGDMPFHLMPDIDFEAVSESEYKVINRDLKKMLLQKMIAGGKLWLTYVNKRGEPRVPRYSLMGMTASLKALSQ